MVFHCDHVQSSVIYTARVCHLFFFFQKKKKSAAAGDVDGQMQSWERASEMYFFTALVFGSTRG